ncbi:CsiV family protein, partial [Pseudomonas shirazensis]
MRAIRCLTLLLTLCAPTAFADGLYQVEMLLVRQNDVPAVTSQFAPEDWRAGA